MILAALLLGTVLGLDTVADTWGPKAWGYLGKGCLKSGTWDKVDIYKPKYWSILEADLCADACEMKNPPKSYKVFSVKDWKCWCSTVLDWEPGCDEDIYVVFPREKTSGRAEAGDMKCNGVAGDGQGGTEKKVGSTSSLQKCAEKVVAKESTANGATWKDNGGDCYAEYGMNGVSYSTTYTTCYIVKAIGSGTVGLDEECEAHEDCQGELLCAYSVGSMFCLNPADVAPDGWEIFGEEEAVGGKHLHLAVGAVAFAEQSTSGPSLPVKVLAAVGLAVTFFGAFKHFSK